MKTVRYIVVLSALAMLAIAQPMFDALSSHPAFFAVRNYSVTEFWLLASIVAGACVLLPAACMALARIGGRRVSSGVFMLCFALLAALLVQPLVTRYLGEVLSVQWSLLLSLSVGTLLVWAYYRFRFVVELMKMLSWCCIVIPLWFVLMSPAAQVLQQSGTESVVADTTIESPVPLIVLIFDEFPLASLLDREFAIDEELFPTFAALREDFTWYRNTVSSADYTSHAVSSMLTGAYRDLEAVPQFDSPTQPSLFSYLGEHYTIYTREHGTAMCPKNVCVQQPSMRAPTLRGRMHADLTDLMTIYAYMVFPQPWLQHLGLSMLQNVLLDVLRESSVEMTYRETVKSLHGLGPSELLYVHWSLPHHLFQRLPSGRTYYGLDGFPVGMTKRTFDGLIPSDGSETRFRWTSEWAALQGLQRHLLQAVYTDHLLGQLMRELRNNPHYDDAMVIISSDHGMRFQEGIDARALEVTGQDDNAELSHIPLFIKYPGQTAGVIDDRAVSLVDVLPTMLAVMGHSAAATLPDDGVSLYRTGPQLFAQRERSMVRVDGSHQKFPVRTSFRDLADAIDRKWGHFSSHPNRMYGLYTMTQHPELIGKDVRQLPVTDVSQGFATRLYMAGAPFQYPEARPAQVDLFVRQPVHVRLKGELLAREDVLHPARLAIANNGRIIATTETTREDGEEVWFSAIVPEDAFDRRSNALEVFIIDSQRGEMILRKPTQMIKVVEITDARH